MESTRKRRRAARRKRGILRKEKAQLNRNGNNCGFNGCRPCAACCAVAPCYNRHGGGCARLHKCCSDPRYFDSRYCDPCGSPLTYHGACMLPWRGSYGDCCQTLPRCRNVCILPSPQPICNPDGRCPDCIKFPLSPPKPPDKCVPTVYCKPDPTLDSPTEPQPIKQPKKPRPSLICPFFYPCPYPCPCCSPARIPCYAPYKLGCPSTCLPCMTGTGMEIDPIPISLPFKEFRRPPFCKNKCDDQRTPEVLKNHNSNNRQSDADDRCCCSNIQPLHTWSVCKQRRMSFILRSNKFCCAPKVCNHVGCFHRPIRNTVCFVSNHCETCNHPFVV